MPDRAPSSTEYVLDKLLGLHFDLRGLGLVVHSLFIRRGLNVVVVRRLRQPHPTTGLAEHRRVNGPGHDRHNAYAQGLQLETQDFRHACFGCLGTPKDACSPG